MRSWNFIAGWPKPMTVVRLLVVAGVLLLPLVATARQEALPDPELLEFLGSFETAKGKAIDPLLFAEPEAPAKRDKDKPTAAKGEKKPRQQPLKKERKDRADEE
jgi:hypothetical protein